MKITQKTDEVDEGNGVREALRERLRETNSLREVANEVGLSWATVSALLKGSGPIGQATLLKLCSGAAPQVAEEANKILSARRAELLRRIAQRAARGLRPYKRWEQDAGRFRRADLAALPDHVADAILEEAGIDADKELQRAMDTVARYEAVNVGEANRVRADLDSRLGDALRASGINAADALAVQALYATAGQSGSHRIVSSLRAVEAWIREGGAL